MQTEIQLVPDIDALETLPTDGLEDVSPCIVQVPPSLYRLNKTDPPAPTSDDLSKVGLWDFVMAL